MPKEISNDFHFAGFLIRLKAFAFDYLVICGYIVVLAAVTMAVIKIGGIIGLSLRWPENPFLADLTAFVTLVLPVILYFTLQESSSKQTTWGKRKVGLRVINVNGGRLTRFQAFVRSLVKLLPWQIGHTCLFQALAAGSVVPVAVTAGYVLLYLLVGIYIASVLISKKRRTPYDWAARSYVIVEKSTRR